MRARKRMITGAIAVGLVLGGGGVARAEPPHNPGPAGRPASVDAELPAGWEITDSAAGPQLTWHAPDPVPMGDAAVEFYSGDRLLGRPRAARDQRTFQLDLARVDPAELAGLQVRAGGRRLDVPLATAPRTRAVNPPALPPKAPVDPGTPGPYQTATGEYRLPPVRLPGFSAPVEMLGVVVAPKGAPGRRPLALFLHGRHSTCFSGTDENGLTGDWPCAEGSRPVPSYRGYLQAQRLLASQGYVTVSISANGINGQDGGVDDGGAQARSSLVRLHLGRWADWAGADRSGAPAIVRAAPTADLSQVLLVGHSRGGEGVNRAALDSLSRPPADQDGYRGRVRWQIQGTVLIGPTIFGHNPVPDLESVTILPGCDGDVYDLQGEMYVDATRGVSRGAALHSGVYVVGANHNYFNTEWTPGQAQAPAWDDYPTGVTDPVCTAGTAATRLTPTQQQTTGATYIAAAARLFVRGDDRVRPLLDGSSVRAPSADPARVLTHAVGAARTPLLVPDASVTVTGDGARVCPQVATDPAVACLPLEWEPLQLSPHFAPFSDSEPGRYAVVLNWSAPGAAVAVRPARPVSVAGAQSVALRVIVPPNTTGTRLDVAVTDTAGRQATLGQVRLDGLPGPAFTASYWGQEVRVPLSAAVRAGLDLRRITSLDLIPRSPSGTAWLVDAWGWRPGTPPARPVALPRVDIGELTVAEGDTGVRTYRVPVTVSGRGHGQLRIFLTDPVTFETTNRVVTVRPGTRTIDLPIEVRGNTRYGDDLVHQVTAKAIRGAIVGDYVGGLTVRDEDPMPEVTVAPVADRVREGESLTWRVTLSTVADTYVFALFPVLPPSSGTELATTDVDPSWFEENAFEKPLPSRPLSDTPLQMVTVVDPGQLTAETSVPTIVDGLSEPEEYLRIQLMTFPPDSWEPVPGTELTGTVLDQS